MWPVPSRGDASVPSMVVAPSRVRHGSERGAERWLLADRSQPGLPGAQPFRGEGRGVGSLPPCLSSLLNRQSLQCRRLTLMQRA